MSNSPSPTPILAESMPYWVEAARPNEQWGLVLSEAFNQGTTLPEDMIALLIALDQPSLPHRPR